MLQIVSQEETHALILVVEVSILCISPCFYHFCFIVLDTNAAGMVACGITNLGSLGMIWQTRSQNERRKGLCWGYWNTCPVNSNLSVYQAHSCAVGLWGMNGKPSEVHICALHHHAILTVLACEAHMPANYMSCSGLIQLYLSVLLECGCIGNPLGSCE